MTRKVYASNEATHRVPEDRIWDMRIGIGDRKALHHAAAQLMHVVNENIGTASQRHVSQVFFARHRLSVAHVVVCTDGKTLRAQIRRKIRIALNMLRHTVNQLDQASWGTQAVVNILRLP